MALAYGARQAPSPTHYDHPASQRLLRPSGIEVIEGAATVERDLAVAMYPYDPTPELRGPLPRRGLRIASPNGEPSVVRLSFEVPKFTVPSPDVEVRGYVSHFMLVTLAGASIAATGFETSPGYPHADEFTGVRHSVFGRRGAYPGEAMEGVVELVAGESVILLAVALFDIYAHF